LGLVIAQAMCLDDPDINVRMKAAELEGEIVHHICEEARRRREQEEEKDNARDAEGQRTTVHHSIQQNSRY